MLTSIKNKLSRRTTASPSAGTTPPGSAGATPTSTSGGAPAASGGPSPPNPTGGSPSAAAAAAATAAAGGGGGGGGSSAPAATPSLLPSAALPPNLLHHAHASTDAVANPAAPLESSIPRADVALPHGGQRKERRRSSIARDGVAMAALAAAAAGAAAGGAASSSSAGGAAAAAGGGGAAPPSATAVAAAAVLAWESLPALRDCPLAKREALLKQKLALCTITGLNWAAEIEGGGLAADGPGGSGLVGHALLGLETEQDRRAKELKRETLMELIEYINSPNGQKILTETVYQEVVAMVSANIFRPVPYTTPLGGGGSEEAEAAAAAGGGAEGGGGGDDDQPYLDPSWPHLQLVYEFLLRFVVSSEVKVKTVKKFIDTQFCAKLTDLFDTEDPRERDYLKTILHRIYGKFLSHRGFIRKAISHVFFRFVYETEKHNGIGELLEILGSIINGFALPLKDEHVHFLEKSLIPLHRPRAIHGYIQQLSFCMVQYVEKDPATICNIVRGLVRAWPWASSSKQILLLNELEELLEIAGPEAAQPVMEVLFRHFAKLVGSTHFQVAERALFLWNNETLMRTGVLSPQHAPIAVPLLYAPLSKQAAGHWNPTVEALAKSVVRHYEGADPALYERTAEGAGKVADERAATLASRKERWAQLEREVREQQQKQQDGKAGSAGSYSPSSPSSSTSSSSSGARAIAAAGGGGSGGGGGGGGGGGKAAVSSDSRENKEEDS